MSLSTKPMFLLRTVKFAFDCFNQNFMHKPLIIIVITFVINIDIDYKLNNAHIWTNWPPHLKTVKPGFGKSPPSAVDLRFSVLHGLPRKIGRYILWGLMLLIPRLAYFLLTQLWLINLNTQWILYSWLNCINFVHYIIFAQFER